VYIPSNTMMGLSNDAAHAQLLDSLCRYIASSMPCFKGATKGDLCSERREVYNLIRMKSYDPVIPISTPDYIERHSQARCIQHGSTCAK